MTDIATDVEPASEEHVEESAKERRARVAFGALLSFTVLVALVSFALSFYGLNDYGRQVMKLPVWLSPLVPVGVDLFSLCGIAATYMLRSAPARVRAYAWMVFLVPTGLSVAGNLAHAVHRDLITAGWVGAAVVPVILALATHLVVVVRRHLEADSPDNNPDNTNQPVGALSGYATFPQVSPDGTLSGNGHPNGNGNHSPNGVDGDTRELRAMALLMGDKTVREVAAELKVDPRTVQGWVDKLHERARPRRSGGRRTSSSPSTSGE